MIVRRYAPFIALAAVQLLLVLVAPSTPGNGGAVALGGTFDAAGSGAGPDGSSGYATTGPDAGGTAATSAPGSSTTTGGTTTSGTTTGGTTTGGTTTGGPAGTTGTGAATGKAVPFCVTGLIEHSPCYPSTYDGSPNGGATASGVTATAITVVMYRNASNAAVDGVTQATGTYISAADEQTELKVAGAWINKHYQLYGRTINWEYYQGTCDPAPPVDSCFRSDADALVAQDHPYAVFWDDDTAESAFFDELSRAGVVNWGGWHFTDQFDDSLRPYHYDVFTGGDVQAKEVGEYYCKKLANAPAKFAGAALQTTTRKAAVIYPDSAEITPSAMILENTIKNCDKNGVVDVPYSSDTTTAASQSTTIVTKEQSDGVTTNIWFSDPIAPTYATKAEASQSFFPEQVIAGSGLLDYDALAQTYDQTEWVHAFGPSDLAQAVPVAQTDAGLIWSAQGQSGSPNANSNLMASYMLTIAGGILGAGAKLTPANFESGLLTEPGYDSYDQYHDPKLPYIKFGSGDYTAVSDVRQVYWSTTATSSINGQPGAYVPLDNGARYQPGEIPAGSPNLPSTS